jgi:tetratricopeptide (TPR) repeat protein
LLPSGDKAGYDVVVAGSFFVSPATENLSLNNRFSQRALGPIVGWFEFWMQNECEPVFKTIAHFSQELFQFFYDTVQDRRLRYLESLREDIAREFEPTADKHRTERNFVSNHIAGINFVMASLSDFVLGDIPFQQLTGADLKIGSLEAADDSEALKEVYYHLGEILLRQNNPASARRQFQRALEIDPDYKEAVEGLRKIP